MCSTDLSFANIRQYLRRLSSWPGGDSPGGGAAEAAGGPDGQFTALRSAGGHRTAAATGPQP